MAGAVTQIDLAHLCGADFTNAFHTDNGGVAVTIRFGVTLRRR